MSDLVPSICVSKAALTLGVHRDTVKRWLKSQKLQGFKTPGGHWRVALSSLENIQKKHG